MIDERLSNFASKIGGTEDYALEQLIEVGNMVLDRTVAPAHISLPERLQRYIDECCTGGDQVAVIDFAGKLTDRIDREIKACADYNKKHKMMSMQDQVAMIAAFDTVKIFIKEMLKKDGIDE